MEIGVKFRGALFSTTLALLLITPVPAVYAYSEAPAAKFDNTAIAEGGAIWYVDSDAAGSNNGTSWANAFNHLQDALASSQQGDDIWVAEGTYTPDQGDDQTATFALINGVGIYGGFAGGETSLDDRNWHIHKSIMSGDLGDGYYSHHVVTGSETDETAIIDGFTIKSGDATDLDGGGGMYNNSGSPTVTNCTFSGNRAGNYGGGMYNDSSSPTLTNCIFSGNSADSNGGGICNFQSSPTVTNCIFIGNSANTGGGMVDVTSSSPSERNCIFSGNSADIGGGMANFNSSSLTVTNCIIWGNSVPNGPQLALVDNSSLTISYSDLEGGQAEVLNANDEMLNWGIGNINLNPDFQDADGSDNTEGTADDNLRLSTISPCIDAGNNTALPSTVSTDLDGYQRIVDGNNDGIATVDMGAYEQPANLTTEEQIQLVVDTVDQLLSTGVINKGQGNALKSKLSAAISSLEKGHIKPAINQLQAFINQVDAYESADILTEYQADLLREAVQNILSSI